ncbi:hypothetical protein Y027_5044 [Burkholderia pseudomallei TSV5]|nr:hypothetical protein Y027_5044 [Burkholderia pseudomallei TSV5]
MITYNSIKFIFKKCCTPDSAPQGPARGDGKPRAPAWKSAPCGEQCDGLRHDDPQDRAAHGAYEPGVGGGPSPFRHGGRFRAGDKPKSPFSRYLNVGPAPSLCREQAAASCCTA